MHYSLDEIRKFLLAGVGLIIGAILLFTQLPVGFQEGVEVLVTAAIGVVAVFSIPNPTQDAVYKALAAFAGAALAMVEFFHTVPASTETQVYTLIGAVVLVVGIWWLPNRATVSKT